MKTVRLVRLLVSIAALPLAVLLILWQTAVDMAQAYFYLTDYQPWKED